MNPAASPAGYRIGHDGDVVFALAPGGPPPILSRLRVGAAAAHCAAQAIAAAVR